METLVPILARGRTERREDLLPAREFAGRVADLQAAMARRGLSALVAWGDRREYGPVCYLSGVVPREAASAVLVPVRDEPALFAGVPSERDLPLIKELTWISDVSLIDALWGRLKRLRQADDGPVGLACGPMIASGDRRRLRTIAGSVAADDLLRGLMLVPRPRERDLLRQASAVTAQAVSVAQACYRAGGSAADALIEAELDARRSGAHDVRVLAGAPGGRSLVPRPGSDRPAPFVFYLAVEYVGYWGEALVTVDADEAVLAQARAAIASAGEKLAAGAAPRLRPTHPIVAEHPIVRLGLSREPLSDDAVASDGVYSLRYGSVSDRGAVLVSATAELEAGQVRWLWP